MTFTPSDEWYDELFDECKTRKEVEERATNMIRYRDKEICKFENKVVTIAEGHVATIESLINQMY